jgi:hypothetical protein
MTHGARDLPCLSIIDFDRPAVFAMPSLLTSRAILEDWHALTAQLGFSMHSVT